jgi:hypothetical protein
MDQQYGNSNAAPFCGLLFFAIVQRNGWDKAGNDV